VKRRDSDGSAEDHYTFGDAIEEDGFLLVFDYNDRRMLAPYHVEHVTQLLTA
jgi:hypothetical protein